MTSHLVTMWCESHSTPPTPRAPLTQHRASTLRAGLIIHAPDGRRWRGQVGSALDPRERLRQHHLSRLRRPRIGIRRQVTVHIDRRLDALVPEPALHHRKGHPRRDQRRGMRVPQIVDARLHPEVGGLHRGLPHPRVERPRPQRQAPRAHEQQVPRITQLLAAGPKLSRQRPRERDRADRPPRLRSPDVRFGVLALLPRLVHAHRRRASAGRRPPSSRPSCR